MTFYVVLWVILMLFGVQYYLTNKIPPKAVYMLMITSLSVIVAARESSVGADTANYVNFYYTGIAPDKLTGVYEPVFMALRYICYWLGFNHSVFFFILAFSSLYIIYVVTEKLDIKNKYLSLFIYFSIVFLSYQFNTIRNGAMASVIWLAFANKLEGRDKAALITMIIAAGFHVVALAFIPVLFFIKKDLSKRTVIVFLVFALLCVFLKLGERLISMFPILANIDRLAGYIGKDKTESYGITLGTIVNLCLFLYMYLYDHKTYMTSESYRIVLNAMLMAIMVVGFFNAFHAIVSRVGQVLNLSLLFVWPLLLDRLKPIMLKIGVCAALCVYMWLFMEKGLAAEEIFSGNLAYIPYEWSFNGLFR